MLGIMGGAEQSRAGRECSGSEPGQQHQEPPKGMDREPLSPCLWGQGQSQPHSPHQRLGRFCQTKIPAQNHNYSKLWEGAALPWCSPRDGCSPQNHRPCFKISKLGVGAVTVAWSICAAFRGSFSRHSYKSQLCCRKGKVLFHCCDINAGHINNFLLSVQCPVKIHPELRILQSECRGSAALPEQQRVGWEQPVGWGEGWLGLFPIPARIGM